MDKDNKSLHNENSIEDSLKSAFGYAEEQLLAEFQQAEQEADLYHNNTGYQNLYSRLVESGYIEKNGKSPKKRYRRLKSAGKVILVAAVLFTLVMMSGIGVVGQKNFEYQPKVVSDVGKNIVWDNTKNLAETGDIEKAYSEIREQLGIKVLKLNYIPNNMKFTEVVIARGHATLMFNYQDKNLHVIHVKYAVENSDGFASDRADKPVYKEIYNKWLDKNIILRKNELNDGNIEYEVELYEYNTYYYIAGLLDEDVFVKIIEEISFE